jgi:nitrilase
MISSPSLADNLATARRLVAQAAAAGAQLVVLPEYWAIMGQQETDKLAHAEQPGSGPIQDGMAQMARQHGIWLIGGTLPLISGEEGKVLNTTLVYDPQGEPAGRYDKIHLFGLRAAPSPTTNRAPSCPARKCARSRRRSAASACPSAMTCAFPSCTAPWAIVR